MRSTFRLNTRSCISIAVTLFVAWVASGEPTKSAHGSKTSADDQRAAALIIEALAAESAGDSASRDAKINQALELAPHLPAARWAAGQVQLHGHWVSLDDAEKRVSHDPIWAQYCELRNSKQPGAESEEELAIWCRKHKLNGQASVHWRRVLNSDPQNAEALKELSLHWFQGALRTNAEIAELKRQEALVAKATKHWQPKLVAWRKEIASEYPATVEKAREGIMSIDDPAVIPVFETLLTHKSADNNSPAFSIEMIRSLSRLEGQEVTCSLARLAIRARWPEARSEAIAQLSNRALIDYVPYVLGLLQSPIQRTSSIYVGPDGNVYHYCRSCQNNFDAEDVRETLEKILPVAGSEKGTTVLVQQILMAREQEDEDRESKEVHAQNAIWATELQNARDLFRANAQTDQGNDLQDLWDWWNDYNELHYSSDKPIRALWNARVKYVMVGGGGGGCSCFVAGTKVSTQTGLRPIEAIKPGDAVLAQDPQTGELAYQCVVATTIRPPSPLKKLTVGNEEIVTTRGHRFWREGRGWQMAKFLTEGGSLHAVSGALPITAVEDAGEDQAYNLVVENFHTYFVGERRILVHDNSAPKPVLGPVPGLSLAEP